MERSDNIQVNTGIKIVYHITLVISILVGFWHFLYQIYINGTIIYLCSMKI